MRERCLRCWGRRAVAPGWRCPAPAFRWGVGSLGVLACSMVCYLPALGLHAAAGAIHLLAVASLQQPSRRHCWLPRCTAWLPPPCNHQALLTRSVGAAEGPGADGPSATDGLCKLPVIRLQFSQLCCFLPAVISRGGGQGRHDGTALKVEVHVQLACLRSQPQACRHASARCSCIPIFSFHNSTSSHLHPWQQAGP